MQLIAPLLAHAPFDQMEPEALDQSAKAFRSRSMRRSTQGSLRRHGLKLRHDWIDLATLMLALFPDRAPKQGSFDLLLIALAEMKRRSLDTVEALRQTERDARWLARH